MANEKLLSYASAMENFRTARRKADFEMVISRLQGKSTELLSYEEVRKKLNIQMQRNRGLQEIPLDAIVGSVGRYKDFTRNFLPRHDSDADRWTRVNLAVTGMIGVPPIEAYKIASVYFVKDGNHRVSIARQLQAVTIQAYVTEIETIVPITPDIDLDKLIIKAEYSTFLKKTSMLENRPNADLAVTAPGKYEDLEEHINVHHYFMGIEQQRDIPYGEAVTHWYDTVYEPIIAAIQAAGLLDNFPNRTATDLYLWTAEHGATLSKSLGWKITPENAAEDLIHQYSAKTPRILRRIGARLLNSITPGDFEFGPPPGKWREKRLGRTHSDSLFGDIIVTINGRESGWKALDQALEIARREDGQIFGLHIVPTNAHKETKAVLDIEAEFESRCAQAEISASLALETGDIAQGIIERGRWADLLVASFHRPSKSDPQPKGKSRFRTLVQRSSIPTLAVSKNMELLNNALLAYDGSPKAEEALFVATYLAARWPDFKLAVITTHPRSDAAEKGGTLARDYLEQHGVQATHIIAKQQPTANLILNTAKEQHSNLIIMGGYSNKAFWRRVFNRALDKVLQKSKIPVLICR